MKSTNRRERSCRGPIDGGAYNAQEIFGQLIYINPMLDFVIFVQSARPTSAGGWDSYLNFPRAVEMAIPR